MAKFVNRTKEIHYLKNWLQAEPNALLFIYGPKSSGKTTLINEVLEKHLDHKKFAINYLNLRRMHLSDYKSFLNRFFPKSNVQKAQGILNGLTIDIGFFKVGVEDEYIYQHDPFYFMEQKLKKAVKKGLQPVLVLDEIQLLKKIYTNGDEFLIDKLFNLFVGLTKELHIAHVIILTSDSYFANQIYTNAKLSKTTETLFINHFEKEDIQKWLIEEGFLVPEINYIWEKLNGSVWEISRIIQKVKNGISLKKAVQYHLDDELGKLREFVRIKLSDQEISLSHQVHQEIIKTGAADVRNYPRDLINQLIPKMIEYNIWFYQTKNQQIVANSKSIWWAMKKIIENQNN